MPTGYTADIAKGITFNKFVMQCARGMGVCITMRDDVSDAPIPKRFEPDKYHAKAIVEAKKELEKIKKITDKQATVYAVKEFKQRLSDINKDLEKKRGLRKKYDAMLSNVIAWASPSPEHVEFKNFMIKQLTESIDFDCNEKYYTAELAEIKRGVVLDGEKWKATEIKRVQQDIAYHTKENKEEIDRVESRNRWLDQLRDSLRGKNECRK